WQAIILLSTGVRQLPGGNRQGSPPEMRMGMSSSLTPTQEEHPMERLLELLGPAVQLVYSCWDRIVLSGYIERLQRPENLVYFFHDVVGVDCVEPATLEHRTNAYKAWVRRTTEEHGIPILAAPRSVRKEELVEPYYHRLKNAEGVACVLTSMEQGRTSSRTRRIASHPAATPTTG